MSLLCARHESGGMYWPAVFNRLDVFSLLLGQLTCHRHLPAPQPRVQHPHVAAARHSPTCATRTCGLRLLGEGPLPARRDRRAGRPQAAKTSRTSASRKRAASRRLPQAQRMTAPTSRRTVGKAEDCPSEASTAQGHPRLVALCDCTCVRPADLNSAKSMPGGRRRHPAQRPRHPPQGASRQDRQLAGVGRPQRTSQSARRVSRRATNDDGASKFSFGVHVHCGRRRWRGTASRSLCLPAAPRPPAVTSDAQMAAMALSPPPSEARLSLHPSKHIHDVSPSAVAAGGLDKAYKRARCTLTRSPSCWRLR